MYTVSRWTVAGFCLVLAGCNDAPLLGPSALDPVTIESEPFRPARVFEFRATAAEGVISVTGTDIDFRPVMQTADGPLGVTGELTAELRRLSGARVRVEGERRAGQIPAQSIEVSSYSVLEVNGERPEIGTITLRDGAPWLAGADTIRLIGASDRLARLDAAKVWIAGRRTDDRLEVGSYGVIRRQ